MKTDAVTVTRSSDCFRTGRNSDACSRRILPALFSLLFFAVDASLTLGMFFPGISHLWKLMKMSTDPVGAER